MRFHSGLWCESGDGNRSALGALWAKGPRDKNGQNLSVGRFSILSKLNHILILIRFSPLAPRLFSESRRHPQLNTKLCDRITAKNFLSFNISRNPGMRKRTTRSRVAPLSMVVMAVAVSTLCLVRADNGQEAWTRPGSDLNGMWKKKKTRWHENFYHL